MKLGVVGLPNVGKSTLFNALTCGKADSQNYPFCTIEPNVGIAFVKDDRLEVLAKMYKSKQIIPAVVEFFDIAGLVKGASQGEGLGNKFLSHIRETNAIIQCVRCFKDENIIKVDNKIDPVSDADIINFELILADLDAVIKKQEKLQKQSKGEKVNETELSALSKIKKVLEDGKLAKEAKLTEDELKYVPSFFLITTKPMLYVANVSEADAAKKIEDIEGGAALKELAIKQGAEIIVVSAKIEADLNELEKDEQELFLADLGLKERALDRLVVASYKLLGYISYITAGEKEVRAWTITKGTKAPGAAGVIHTDFERGFIKAEVVSYDDLIKSGNYVVAKEKGLVRIEGKEYTVKDGDVMLFKFNV